jgi:hypothetical protein
LPAQSATSKTWGITVSVASYYSPAGKNQGTLPGGVIMDIEESRATSRGAMSLGRVERDGAMNGPFLIADVDLVRFGVARAEIPEDSLAILKQFYGLKGRLDQRISELRRQAVGANPYAQAYNEAVQKYNDFGKREAALVAKRNQSEGAERMKYMDTLREMIPEGNRLKRSVEEARSRYEKWNAANPGVATAPNVSNDTQVQDLRRQMAELEPKLKDIVQ